MPGLYPTRQTGPDTYEVSVAVTGGQLVMPDATTGKVKPTTGAVATVLGVALNNGVPAGSGAVNDFSVYPSKIDVAYGPMTVKIKAATDIAFGVAVVSAALGQVGTVGSGTFDQIVGRCVEPGGITSGNAGLIRLN